MSQNNLNQTKEMEKQVAQRELNNKLSRLERRLEYLEQRMLDLGNYTPYRAKKSKELLQEYESIQDTIQRLCHEFRKEWSE